MPPNCIEISDDEGKKILVVPCQIRALALVADINTRIEETNSTIRTHKDDIAHLKKLLRSAEERLEKDQGRRLKLIEEKNEALDLGVAEINVKSGLGNGVKVGMKHEVKREPRKKMEELSQVEMGRGIRQRSIFLGVQIPFRKVGSSSTWSKSVTPNSTPVTGKQAPPFSAQRKQTAQTTQIIGGLDDDNSDWDVPMGGYDSADDSELHYQPSAEEQSDARRKKLVSPLTQTKPLRTIPTRGRGWRGGGNAGRIVGSRGASSSIPTIPLNSKSFRRDTISLAIGGQLQHTWPTPDQNGDFSIKVVRYCCVRRELNWCLPSRPGDSGNALIFSSKPADGADFPLFIRDKASDWKYYGDYRITECCTVSLQEWRSFEESQKATWCKFILTKKNVLGKHFQEGELGRDDWGKVYDLFEKEDTDPHHLRITARKLQFVRYNREMYDLLEEISIDQQTSAVKKRTVTHAVGFSDDGDNGPQLAMERPRRKRNRVSYIEHTIDSSDNDTQPPGTTPLVQNTQRSIMKDEPSDNDDDNDLYSAPSVPGPGRISQTLVQVHSPGGGDDSHAKLDANQLIKVLEPPIIPNMPKFPTNKFTRRFLSKFLGGCEQAQECVISETKKKEQIYALGVYYCERPEWAPDLPAKPGVHGVVYGTHCGSGLVDFNYSSYPVFCRRRVNEWEYCGEYQITRRSFVPGEWSRVAPVAKKSWSEGFAGKRGKWGITHMRNLGIIAEGQTVTAQDVLRFIDDGLIQLECQVYICLGYNRELYDTLSAKWELERKGPAMKKEMLDEED